MKWGIFSSALFLLLLLACEKKPIPLGDYPGAQIFNGIVRADVRCYRCHGDIGQGSSRAPALVTNGKTIPRDLFIKTVLNGRDRMPPFESVLSEKDISEIITWLEAVAVLPK
ncbi:MAG: cytochrome c [Nitrospirae bacterium]|nr:cytochrome c [Candidatus Troglogloeales bacterium]